MSLPLLRKHQKCCVVSVLGKGHSAFNCSYSLVHHLDSISDPYLIVKQVIYLYCICICEQAVGFPL